MKRAQLQAVQAEYVRCKEEMQPLHRVWYDIMAEYQIQTVGEVTGLVAGRVGGGAGDDEYMDEYMSALGTGHVASLNNLVDMAAARISIRRPEFTLDGQDDPRNDSLGASVLAALRGVQQQQNWSAKTRELIPWALLTGTGVFKIGIDSELVYGQGAWAANAPNENQIRGIEKELGQGPSVEPWSTVRPGDPSVIVVPTYDIFVNPGVHRREHVRRIYHRTWRPLKDVVFDGRLRRKARSQVTTVTPAFGDHFWSFGTGAESYQNELQLVEQVECYDVVTRQFCIFAPGCDEALLDWTELGLPIDNPYHFIQLKPSLVGFWGMPYALQILGQAKALNLLRAILIDRISEDAKSVNLYDPNDVSEEMIMQLRAARHGDYVPYDKLRDFEGKSPIVNVNFPTASPQLLELMSIFESDQARMSGLTDVSRNRAAKNQTATEVERRQQAEGVMIEDYLARNEQFQEKVAADAIKIILAFWGPSRMVRVLGPRNELLYWVELDRQRVLADYSLHVVAGSSEKLDRVTTRAHWNEMLPRIVELTNQMRMEEQYVMQGFQPSPVNWLVILDETLKQYDPTLCYRVLSMQRQAELLLDLVNLHGVMPQYISPQMAEQVQLVLYHRQQMEQGIGPYMESMQARLAIQGPQTGPGGVLPGGAGGLGQGGRVAPFPVRTNIPTSSGVRDEGMGTGRPLSEAMG